MKQQQLIFNVIGFTIGIFLAMVGCSEVLHRYRTHTSLITCAIAALIGLGGFINLANRHLGRLPTWSVIIGCFISVIFIPLGIWGIVLLMMESKRSRRRHR